MNSKYFKREEFACKCSCGFATVDAELLDVLEDVRDYFGNAVTINSGCRCDWHNEKIGGSRASKHKLGIAADIVVSNIEPHIIHEYLDNKYAGQYGLGLSDNFVHIDVRESKARWTY